MTALAMAKAAPAEAVGSAAGWTAVCRLGDLEPERGVAALVEGHQIALFRSWDDDIYALDHLDPYSGAYVMARGIVGSRGEVPTVASPMFKQVFDLRTGACLDDDSVRVQVHEVRVETGSVEVRLGGRGEAGARRDGRLHVDGPG
jgi:nitrite reductase (NADH) small subunit